MEQAKETIEKSLKGILDVKVELLRKIKALKENPKIKPKDKKRLEALEKELS